MPDDTIRIGTRVDVSPLEQLAQKLKEDGLSAQDTASALRNLGVSAKEASATVESLYGSSEELSASLDKTSASMARMGAETASTTGQVFKARLAWQELGIHVPTAMTRAITSIGPMAGLVNAAFPILVAVGFVEILDKVPDAIQNITNSLAGWDKAAQSAYQAQLRLNQQALQAADRLFEANLRASEAGLTGTAKLKKEQEDNVILAEHWRQRIRELSGDWKNLQGQLASAELGTNAPLETALRAQGMAGDMAARVVHWLSTSKGEAEQLNQEIIKTEGQILSTKSKLDELTGPKAKTIGADLGTSMEKDAEKAAKAIKKAQDEWLKAHIEAGKKARELDRQIAEEELKMQQEITRGYAEEAKKRQELSLAQADTEHDANLDKLKTQEASVKGMGSTGQINKGSELQALRAIHEQELAEDIRFIQEKIKILALDPENNAVAMQKLQAQLQSIRTKGHQQEIADTAAILKQQQAHYQQFFNTIGHGFDTAINGWIQGTQRIDQAFQKMGASIVVSLVQSLAKMTEQWIAHELAITLAHQAGNQARVASDATAAAQSNGIQMISTLKTVSQEAVKAAAKVYSATAGIPVVGPVLAPVAAGAAFAAVMGFEALASFDTGTMAVPKTGIAMLHANESVLPPPQTEVLREALGGGSSQRSNLTVHNETNINPMGDESFKGMLDRHNDYIVASIVKTMRRKNLS